jgi:hypothetical protein
MTIQIDKIHEPVRLLLEREKLTPYALALRLKGEVSQRSVYDFLEGKDVRISTLAAILNVCEIQLDLYVPEAIPDQTFVGRKRKTLKDKWQSHKTLNTEGDKSK